MTKSLDDLLPTADEVMKKIALAEAEKAAEAFRKQPSRKRRKEEAGRVCPGAYIMR
jgi:hypothetical protein